MKKFLLFMLVLLSGLILSANAAEGDYIIKYRSDAPRFYAEDSANSLGAGMHLVSREEALALKDAGMLEICEPDLYMTYHATPPTNDPYLGQQYNLGMIKATFPWSLKTYGNDVLVAVIDSGLALNHPDIDYSRVVQGYNFAANPLETEHEDTQGHGTMVAGTIIAKRDNSVGIAGVADKVKLLPLKVADSQGNISVSAVIKAIDAASGYFGCDVINISLGLGTDLDAMKTVIGNALRRGTIIVCSAGNDTPDDPGDHLRYPASYPGVIGVGSVDSSYSHVESSVVNKSVHISAPGYRVPTLHYTGEYVYANGTSFAAPQVAAAAAIAKCIKPDITPAQFANLLRDSAYRPDATAGQAPVRNNETGYGTLNLERMIRLMLSGRKTYVAPIANTNTAYVFNLTGEQISMSSVLASYYGNKMVQYDHKTITIPVNGCYTHVLTPNERYNNVRHYLWNSISDLTPFDKKSRPRFFPE